ncbi:MAG: hypothetical protein J7527_17510 [Chitinophagaceae bacterium]|nr:hypothetical protein [Chitinophagaceae bacterium]
MTTIITVSILLVVLFLLLAFTTPPGENDLDRLTREYDSALAGVNKKEALKVGRLYYSALRKNKALTLFDEMAIANDLSTMRQEVYLIQPVDEDPVSQGTAEPIPAPVVN